MQNWPIRWKVASALLIPLTALVLLGVNLVLQEVHSARTTERTRAFAAFSIRIDNLIDQVQTERFAVSTYVGSAYHIGGSDATGARGHVDSAAAALTAAAGDQRLGVRSDPRVRAALAAVQRQLGRLPAYRQVVDGHRVSPGTADGVYNDVISALLNLGDAQVAIGSGHQELVREAIALTSISHATEAADQERGYVSALLFLHQLTPVIFTKIRLANGAEAAWTGQFTSSATPSEQAYYSATVGAALTTVNGLRDRALTEAQTNRTIDVSPQGWLDASGGKVDRLRQVESKVTADLGARSHSLSKAANRHAWLVGLFVALIFVASVVLSTLIARRMVRQLRGLRSAALDVAERRLPAVMSQLRQGRPIDPDAETSAVEVLTNDEIGEVAAAFNTVHAAAVRGAVEAVERRSIGDLFLNLARRSQALIHRELKIIDAMERNESEPENLKQLFQLDHLVTRMRRHAEDLIVLSGNNPARGWRKPVTLVDVIRSATGEVEDYTRVNVLQVVDGAVNGRAVGDVIHMLAELIENATSFSPPATPVQVTGHEVGTGCAIEIEDRGIGLPEETISELNDRLAAPSPFDLTTSERLGLFVVGRLAGRHGIKVRLKPSPYGGVTAIVLLPKHILTAELDQSGTDSGPGPGGLAGGLGGGLGSGLDGGLGGGLDGGLAGPEGGVAYEPPGRGGADYDSPATRNGVSNGAHGAGGYDPTVGLDDTVDYNALSGLGVGGYDSAAARPGAGDYDPTAGANFDPTVGLADGPAYQASYGTNATPSHVPPGEGGMPVNEGWVYSGAGGLTPVDGMPGVGLLRDPPAPRRGPDEPAPRPADPLPSGVADLGLPKPSGLTDYGLPKRRRGAHQAPRLRKTLLNGRGDGAPPMPPPPPQSPEEVRRLVQSFQVSYGRGLADGAARTGPDDESWRT